MEENNKELTKLNRHQLGLISVEDLKDPMADFTENERKEYVALVASVYSLLKKEIETAIATQGNFSIRMADTWEKTLIGRGGINMGDVLLNRFSELKNEHLSNIRPDEKFDKHEVI